MRGKPPNATAAADPTRIIPARAGQTGRKDLHGNGRPDHPRACGANGRSPRCKLSTAGSSPRVRGKHCCRTWWRSRRRIIPARAGQTPAMPHRAGSSPDHPRACGANNTTDDSYNLDHGSSPRVRGKLTLGVHVGDVRRIIPARAGQTMTSSKSIVAWTDHPRACGANTPSLKWCRYRFGSSPRVRGKQPAGDRLLLPLRIIPARAGQTGTSSVRHHRRPDHPRACGANQDVVAMNTNMIGSSPRVRGKRNPKLRLHARGRIIPARAGQTAARRESGCP